MTNLNLIVLSYHQFYDEPNEYVYSRTYDEFLNDLKTKTFDLITIDDAHFSSWEALLLMKMANRRAILFVATSLIGMEDYLTWEQIERLSEIHEIGNHSHNHVNLQTLSQDEIKEEILTANNLIEKHTGKIPRFFVPPFNKYNNYIDNLAEKFGLQILKNRIDVLNTTK